MKKTKSTKKVKASAAKIVAKDSCNVWSWTIYVYWFIILFFIAATFYIIGRGQEFLHPAPSNVAVVEEQFDKATQFIDSVNKKILDDENAMKKKMLDYENAAVQEEKLMKAIDYVDVAKAKLKEGNIDEAIADLNTAIETGADSNTYALRGEAYMQIGNYQKALNDFDEAIKMDGMNAIAFYDRYLLDTRLENYDAALTDINNALAAQSMNPVDILNMRDLYAKRGQLNLWMKNWQGAIADYTNSLARTEGSISAAVYAERAEAYTALGEYENAVNDYTSAVRIVSEQIQATPTQEEREQQSSYAMGYFEKSAALNLKLDKIDAAKNDLESAFAIAVALNDEESMARIQNLIAGLN